MTWDELKEKAKEMGYKWGVYFNGKEYLVSRTETIITLSEIGTIEIKDGYENEVMFHNRTPDQMLMIMRGLK